ncbi:hypothetical protein N7445_003864 [Penicillium cf. griseofulvum]|nr:hypothetical protein N7445_003864 [Penicillium cf. griseofulvum]
MALSVPRYHESPVFFRHKHRLRGNEPQPPQPPSAPSAPTAQTITPTSVVLDYGQGTPMIVNCVHQLSNPNEDAKAVCLADLDGRSVFIKCWRFDLEELGFGHNEHPPPPHGTHLFAKWISRGKIICSSVFPSGYIIVLEYRDGARLSTIWHKLNELERTHIQTQFFNGINALRQVVVRLSDPRMHNMLYDRQRRTVTLHDFEVAV